MKEKYWKRQWLIQRKWEDNTAIKLNKNKKNCKEVVTQIVIWDPQCI